MGSLTRPRGSRRGKPLVAERSEAEALANILAKIRILNIALGQEKAPEDLNIHALLAECPRSPRKFNSWTYESLPAETRSVFPEFKSNSQKTLVKNKLSELVSNLTRALTQRAVGGDVRTKVENLAAKKREIDEAMLLKRIAMKELGVERALTEKITATLAAMRSELASLQEEAKEQIQNLLKENSNYRKALNISSSIVELQAGRLYEKIVKAQEKRR